MKQHPPFFQFLIVSILAVFSSCVAETATTKIPANPDLDYMNYVSRKTDRVINRNTYQITQTTKKAYIEALESGFLDIEDGVQYRSAIHEDDIEYFVTSNVGDLKKSTPELPVITPGEFVHKFHI